VTIAGPKARAGLQHMEETGPMSHMSRVTIKGMAMGFRRPHLDLNQNSQFVRDRVFTESADSSSSTHSSHLWLIGRGDPG